MTSSEAVLYQINHVKHKKDVGTLYVMYERICWIQGNRDIVSVSHNYADIKSQKISSDGKPKIQIQIVLHENNATFTFEFVDPEGPQKRIEARTLVVEYLRQVLPKYGQGRDNELSEKNRLLSEDETLFQLYKDLVTNGIISAEEFWSVHAEQYLSQNRPSTSKQNVGISSGFLSGIQPNTDGSNGICYNLSTEIIEAIFKTYPAVRRKHFECVPSQMTEAEFWIKFFQSHYFHRDRLPTIQDLFSDCAKADDKEMRRTLERLRQQDIDVLNLLEDPGLQDDNKELLTATVDKKDQNSGVGIHKSMIKRFNQHSIMLLNAYERNSSIDQETGKSQTQETKKSKKNAVQTDLVDSVSGESTAPVNGNHVPVPSEEYVAKRPKLDEFEDLQSETTQNFQKLNLTKIDRYLNGPIPDHKTDQVAAEHVNLTIQTMRDIAARWAGRSNILDSKTAVNMLGELNPGGSMMKLNFSENAAQSLSPELETEIRNTYVALSEILRHFWLCFPPTTAALQEKLVKTRETIKKFEQIKLQRLTDELKRDHHDPAIILGHLYSILDAAHRKYSQWVNRKK